MSAPVLVLGLGNPGPRYHRTRHNVGFDLIEALSVYAGRSVRKPWFRPLRWTGQTHPLILAQPLTFMNRSGEVLPWLMDRSGVTADRVIVLVDNMDLPPGEVRMKKRGSTAGHNGLKSVSAAIGSDEYPRLYIGVGRPVAGIGTIEHVLGRFSEGERLSVDAAIDRVVPVLAGAPDIAIDQLISRINAVRRPGGPESGKDAASS